MSRQQSSAVFLYVSCSRTKRAEAGRHVRLGTVANARTAPELEPAMALWREAVEAVPKDDCVRAIDLYGGGIWGLLRSEVEQLRKDGIELRIISAGLGLLSPDDRVPAYDATFAPGGRHSIGGARDAIVRNREWWRLLTEWNGISAEPRSLYATVRQYSEAAHVIALPADYIDAVLEDFFSIQEDKGCLQRTVVLTSPYWTTAKRIPDAVKISGDLYGALGGTRGTVLARAGLHLAKQLKREVADARAIARALRPLHARTKPLPIRTPQSDAEVTRFIESELSQKSGVGHTTLLRRYRAKGFACEYTRFRKLHAAAKSAN